MAALHCGSKGRHWIGVAYNWEEMGWHTIGMAWGMGRHGIEAAWDPCSRLGWDSLVAAWGGLGWDALVAAWGGLGWNALVADLDGIPLWRHGADLDGMPLQLT